MVDDFVVAVYLPWTIGAVEIDGRYAYPLPLHNTRFLITNMFHVHFCSTAIFFEQFICHVQIIKDYYYYSHILKTRFLCCKCRFCYEKQSAAMCEMREELTAIIYIGL